MLKLRIKNEGKYIDFVNHLYPCFDFHESKFYNFNKIYVISLVV